MITDTEKEVLTVLKGAREFLSVPERWNQWQAYRFVPGYAGNGWTAKSACAFGALSVGALHILPKGAGLLAGAECKATRIACFALEKTIPDELGYAGLIDYNDTEGRTHEEILALYDKTIAMVESGGLGGDYVLSQFE